MAAAHPAPLYNLLMQSAAETLREVAANPLPICSTAISQRVEPPQVAPHEKHVLRLLKLPVARLGELPVEQGH